MWSMLLWLLGASRVRISGAGPAWALSRLSEARILLREVTPVDAFTIEARILTRDASRAEAVCTRAMCAMEVLDTSGFSRTFSGLRRRWCFALLLTLAVAAGYFLPKLVFFYRVSGNDRVPAEQILQELQSLGVGFGTYGPDIKPQELKNQMLRRIPALQWLTVTQNGMCAEVVVRERPEREPVLDRKTPQNVVASRAGIITEVLCLDGNCLVAPGQAVTTGQLLVSAYTDLEYKTQVSAARAEIYAKTVRRTETVLPDTTLQKRPAGERRQLSLLLGDRRIALSGCKDPGPDCDKTTERRFLTLPGGYFLPIGLEIVTIFSYDTYEAEQDADAVRASLEQFASRRIRADLIAGTAERLDYRFTQTGGCFRLETRAECEEMIARQTGVAFLKDGDQ